MSIPYILTDTSVTVILNFTPKIVDNKHPNFKRIVELLGNPATTEDQLSPLLDIPKAIATFTSGAVYVKDGKLFLNGAEVRTSLGQIIMKFIRSGQPEFAEPLKAFLANVALNPDPRAQIDLYDWVQASGLPITSDGCILAWKAVTENYRSLHCPNDPQFDHHIGNRVEQKRDECDADPNQTCSSGLHFCGAAYLKSYLGGGARIVVVKIHPKDVVSFPKDYHLQKGRACGYDIVGEVPGDKVAEYYPQGVPVYKGFDPEPAPVVKTAPRNGKFAVGQTWATRNGQTVTITAIDGKDVRYPICGNNGAEYDLSGRYLTKKAEPVDLLRLITDVA